MTDNCILCGHFMSSSRDDDNHCDTCLEIIIAEGQEWENGIGTGTTTNYPDENNCRHCVERKQ